MSEIKKILYPSKIEENNLGDILINALLVRELTKNKEVYFKGKPNQQLLNLITYNNKYSDNIKIINQIDISHAVWKSKLQTLAYLIKGSNFYMVFDTPGHHPGFKSMYKNILKLIFDSSKILCYLFFKIKYVKYGITLGPFSGIVWGFQRIISKLCFLIVPRDQKNADLLLEKGLKNTISKPDLAFLLVKENGILANKKKKISLSDSGIITVSLRGSLVGKSLDQVYFEKITEDTIALIHNLKKTKKVKRVNISYQVDADQKTSFLLEKRLKKEFNDIDVILYKNILHFQEASDLYLKSGMVITNRLHVFLFAMACSTKSFIVTDIDNHMKIISIAEDLNLDSLIYRKDSVVDWNTEIVKEFLITAKGCSKELQDHIASL